MALSSILGLPIMYLFPDAQEKPAIALCIVTILIKVIAQRNKVTKFLWPFCLCPHWHGILETKPFNAGLAIWIVSHSIYSFNVPS